MAVKKRCNFCLKPLRNDGTCANPQCPRYEEEEGPVWPIENEPEPNEKKDGQE